MMTWNSVDLPEPVLPAISACWRVPLPISRYCSFVAPERPMGTRNSSVVSSVQICPAAGATCSKRHLDAVGILAAFADAMQKFRRRIPATAARRASGACRPAASRPVRKLVSARTRQTLFLRSSSGTKSCGRRVALVPVNEREDAAARAVGGDVAQPPRRGVAEIHREIDAMTRK